MWHAMEELVDEGLDYLDMWHAMEELVDEGLDYLNMWHAMEELVDEGLTTSTCGMPWRNWWMRAWTTSKHGQRSA